MLSTSQKISRSKKKHRRKLKFYPDVSWRKATWRMKNALLWDRLMCIWHEGSMLKNHQSRNFIVVLTVVLFFRFKRAAAGDCLMWRETGTSQLLTVLADDGDTTFITFHRLLWWVSLLVLSCIEGSYLKVWVEYRLFLGAYMDLQINAMNARFHIWVKRNEAYKKVTKLLGFAITVWQHTKYILLPFMQLRYNIPMPRLCLWSFWAFSLSLTLRLAICKACLACNFTVGFAFRLLYGQCEPATA